MAGPLVTVGAIQSINFAIYDSVRRYLHHQQHQQQQQQDHSQYPPHTTSNTHGCYLTHDPLSHVAFASMTAGACLAVVTNPLMLVKTQQQTSLQTLTYRQAVLATLRAGSYYHHHHHHHHQTAATATTAALVRRGAWRNLYAGFVPHATVEIVGRGIYYVAYEALKRRWMTQDDNDDDDNNTGLSLSLPNRMLAAGVAGVITWTAIFPLDAVRCRMFAAATTTINTQQQQQQQQHSNRSSLTVATRLLQQSGWRAFYRGYAVTLLRAGPVSACVLPIYDLALARLSTV